ncbi:MAG: alpha/beta hydrolase [Halanaerobacter sp.]
MGRKVVLVHGYSKGKDDMRSLKENLTKLGYRVKSVDLPLTFKRLEAAASQFGAEMEKIIANTEENEEISLVGHSTGGLIMRYFISQMGYEDKIDRAVLIATPNQGSQLADLAAEISDSLVDFLKTLDSLQPEKIRELELEDVRHVEIGAIAGNKSDLLLGYLLEGENDGRVEVDAVRYEGLDDFILLPYNHLEIHHQLETAEVVASFLEEGEFGG